MYMYVCVFCPVSYSYTHAFPIGVSPDCSQTLPLVVAIHVKEGLGMKLYKKTNPCTQYIHEDGRFKARTVDLLGSVAAHITKPLRVKS